MLAREEFERRQIGEMAVDRLLHIDFPAAGALLRIGHGAVEVGAGPGGLELGKRAFERGGAAIVVGPDQRDARARTPAGPVREGLRRSGRTAMIARIESERFRRASQPFQDVRLHQDGGTIIGVDGQRAVEARQPAVRLAGAVVSLEEVEPDRRRARLGGGGALEPATAPAHRRR